MSVALSKIIKGTTELASCIQSLQDTASENSGNTHRDFQLVIAKSSQCESLLHLLVKTVSDHLSGGLSLQLAKIKSQTKQIKTASNNMDCKSMLDGIKALGHLTDGLEACVTEIQTRADHLIKPSSSLSEETQTQVYCFLHSAHIVFNILWGSLTLHGAQCSSYFGKSSKNEIYF